MAASEFIEQPQHVVVSLSNPIVMFDYAKDNDSLKGTDAYWALSDARWE